MRACRAYSAGIERIPLGAAAVVEIFGMAAIPACPEACAIGRPSADRTADSLRFVLNILDLAVFNNFFAIIALSKKQAR